MERVTVSYGVLIAAGIRVRRVADLEEGALYLKKSKLLLLDNDLPDASVDAAVDEILPMAWS